MHSIDERMLAFVAWHGEIPPEAEIIEGFRARQDAIWIRQYICGRHPDYAFGFALAERWWALFFDRVDGPLRPEGAELWNIECYGSGGNCWSGWYHYWPEHNRWRHQYFEKYGEDFGRYGKP